MKSKSLVLMLVLALSAWAQSASPGKPQQSIAPDTKAKCACSDKMSSADAKDGQACMRHKEQSSDGKDMATCCAGKDGKSCCGDKTVACVRSAKEKGCCGDCGNDKSATTRCGDPEQARSGPMDSSKCCCSKTSERLPIAVAAE